ncbi:hypothetical protein F5B22DRAFT_630236 [Xylaria bambusicola]|uniref:uncharacterized protein n=1 Tax=Xylaria bambusicola TaxID=326684 RepID=UPI002007549A|nr:uncharacterized protein F5B22DRAFT_630236 [Xylaria bambusicola]KAI0503179.1 hypothetical protein F5B22DRAFT_630236 [Xylaria bambusicola]
MFTLLGICSACVDVSSHITKHEVPFFPGITGYYLPHRDEPIVENNDGFRNVTVENFIAGTLSDAAVALFPEETISFDNTVNSTTFMVLRIVQSQLDYINNISTWATAHPKATECGLYFCTNLYSASIVEGVLNETLLASWSNRDANSYEARGNLSLAPDDWQPHKLYSYQDFTRSDLQLFIPDDKAAALQIPNDQPTQFNISQITIQAMINLLIHTICSSDLRFPAKNAYPITSTVGIGDIIGNSSDLNATFRAVAESMTAYIRNQGYESFPQYGVSQSWVLHYRIRWEFILPPLILTLAGCVFLVYTIWETQSLGLTAWKESTLATLAHGLDILTRTKLREAYRDGTEDRSARGITVLVEKSLGGLELCEVRPSDTSQPAPHTSSRSVHTEPV